MPVFKSGKGLAPAWCELEYFEIVRFKPGEKHTFERTGRKEKLILGRGKCEIRWAGQSVVADGNANLDLADDRGRFEIRQVHSDAVLIRMCGRWGAETGGSGRFPVEKSPNPRDGGDPVNYPKETCFDNHYHDCDEYWIVFEGSGVAVSEGRSFEVGPGDCIATGMGIHHDFPIAREPVRAVYFETTLEGRKRLGHLWNHKHGPAEPKSERT